MDRLRGIKLFFGFLMIIAEVINAQAIHYQVCAKTFEVLLMHRQYSHKVLIRLL